jgi:hypothetical protein
MHNARFKWPPISPRPGSDMIAVADTSCFVNVQVVRSSSPLTLMTEEQLLSRLTPSADYLAGWLRTIRNGICDLSLVTLSRNEWKKYS